MSKKRMAIQLVIAIFFAGVASYAAMHWMQSREEVSLNVAEIETVSGVVAATPIPAGTVLEASMLKAISFLPASLPDDSYQKEEQVVGRVTVHAIGLQEVVTEGRLAPKEVTSGGVCALITPGKRAMAVTGNKVLGLSGFVRPGDQLDVLVSMKLIDTKKPVTKVVLENLKVLATGSELVSGENGKKSSPVDVYTLEVTPQESEFLALASTQGELHFALRHATDSETVLTSGADEFKTLSAYRPENKKSAPLKAKRKGYRAVVMKGTETKTVWLKR